MLLQKIGSSSLLIVLLLLVVTACQEERIPIPKPRIYPKVDYPVREYVVFDQDYCAFTFQYPSYMVFEQDVTFVNQDAKHLCWFNLKIPDLNGVVHFTYTDITGKTDEEASEKLMDVVLDSYDMTEKHNIKATGRSNYPFEDPTNKIYGVKYSVEGDVASPYHFVLTDSTQHAVWAALYFNSRPNADSMRPIVNYVKEDLDRIIQSFSWNKNNSNQSTK